MPVCEGPIVPLGCGGVALVHASQVLLSQSGLHAHSTLVEATSWVHFSDVSVQVLCVVASWSSPLTFVRYYKLEVSAPLMEQAVLKS